MPTKTKADPLPVRTSDRYHARPSTTERGQWTIMLQVAGETRLRLFARAAYLEAAVKILSAFSLAGFDVETINPVRQFHATVLGASVPIDIYADGTTFVSGVWLGKKSEAWDVVVVEETGATLRDLADAIEGACIAEGGAK